MNKETVILGVDPGTVITGYGVIKKRGNSYEALDYGCIRPPRNIELHDRYLIIHQAIERIVMQHSPSVLVIETQYIHKNVQSALKLARANVSVALAAKKMGVCIAEYYPTVVKKAVTGIGNASKRQVQGMIQKLLGLEEIPQPEDAADALALAICHAHKLY